MSQILYSASPEKKELIQVATMNEKLVRLPASDVWSFFTFKGHVCLHV